MRTGTLMVLGFAVSVQPNLQHWVRLAIPTPPESHQYLPTVPLRNRLDR